MKCIKCNYTSFDFNPTCPKCGKDLSVEAEKLHLSPYKPTPPYLLTSLTGEAGGSKHSSRDKQSEIPFFPENKEDDASILNKSTIEPPDVPGESPQDDVDNEMMVALDELSFEYDPTLKEESETPGSSHNEDLYTPEFSQQESAPSTDSVLFDNQTREEAPLFPSTEETDQQSSIIDPIEGAGAIENRDTHLDLFDMDQAVDQDNKDDELRISLNDLTFEQEPVSPKKSLEREDLDENVLSVSELLDFPSPQNQTDPVMGLDTENTPVSKIFEDDLAENFEISTHSDISDQPENMDDYIKLDLSDIDQFENRDGDDNALEASFDHLSLDKDDPEKTVSEVEPEEDGFSFTPDMLNFNETSSHGDNKAPDLFSDEKAEERTKGGKTKTDTTKNQFELDILEMELNKD